MQISEDAALERETAKFLDDYAAVKGKSKWDTIAAMTGCLACLPPFPWPSGWLSPLEVRGLQIPLSLAHPCIARVEISAQMAVEDGCDP